MLIGRAAHSWIQGKGIDSIQMQLWSLHYIVSFLYIYNFEKCFIFWSTFSIWPKVTEKRIKPIKCCFFCALRASILHACSKIQKNSTPDKKGRCLPPIKNSYQFIHHPPQTWISMISALFNTKVVFSFLALPVAFLHSTADLLNSVSKLHQQCCSPRGCDLSCNIDIKTTPCIHLLLPIRLHWVTFLHWWLLPDSRACLSSAKHWCLKAPTFSGVDQLVWCRVSTLTPLDKLRMFEKRQPGRARIRVFRHLQQRVAGI